MPQRIQHQHLSIHDPKLQERCADGSRGRVLLGALLRLDRCVFWRGRRFHRFSQHTFEHPSPRCAPSCVVRSEISRRADQPPPLLALRQLGQVVQPKEGNLKHICPKLIHVLTVALDTRQDDAHRLPVRVNESPQVLLAIREFVSHGTRFVTRRPGARV